MPTSTFVDVLVLERKYLVKGKSLRRAIFSLAFGVSWGLWLAKDKTVFLGYSTD